MELHNPDLQILLASQLAPGERVLWIGRPGTWGWQQRAFRRLPNLLRSFWLWAVTAVMLAVARDWAYFGLQGVAISFAVLAWGLACLVSIHQALVGEGRRWYVLTDRRALSLSAAGHPFVLSCRARLKSTPRVRPDGSGDLRFAGTVLADGQRSATDDELVFYGIPDVAAVEGLLAGEPEALPEVLPDAPADLSSAQVIHQLAGWLHSRLGERRAAAVTLLAGIGSPAEPVLVKALGDREKRVRTAAAEALSRMVRTHALGQGTVDALIRASTDEDEPVREQAQNALRRLGAAAVLPLLASGWSGDGYRSGPLAVMALVGDTAFATAILKALDEANEQVAECLRPEFTLSRALPRHVIRAWSGISTDRPETLLQVVACGPEWAAMAAAEALAASGAGEIGERLAVLLDAGRAEARLAVGIGLGFLEDARGLPVLVAAVRCDRREVRHAAARSVGCLGSAAARALPALEAQWRFEKDPYTLAALGGALLNIRSAVRAGPVELEAADAPSGRGTEPESAPALADRGTELSQGNPAPDAPERGPQRIARRARR